MRSKYYRIHGSGFRKTVIEHLGNRFRCIVQNDIDIKYICAVKELALIMHLKGIESILRSIPRITPCTYVFIGIY